MSMLPMALGACRDSGCSLVFLDSGKLWAFAPFSTAFFPVRKHQGRGIPGVRMCMQGILTYIHIWLTILQPFRSPLQTSLPRICPTSAVILATTPGPSLNPQSHCAGMEYKPLRNLTI